LAHTQAIEGFVSPATWREGDRKTERVNWERGHLFSRAVAATTRAWTGEGVGRAELPGGVGRKEGGKRSRGKGQGKIEDIIGHAVVTGRGRVDRKKKRSPALGRGRCFRTFHKGNSSA